MRGLLLAGIVAGCGFTNTVGGINGDDVVPTGPTIDFEMVMQEVTETPGGTTVDVIIRLSEPSSRGFTLSFNSSGTASAGDFFFVNPPPSLSVSAGVTTAQIRVQIHDDGEVEGVETIDIVLLSTTLGTLGAQTTHTILINDDDAACFGQGAFAACFTAPPVGMRTLPATIDTDSNADCDNQQPLGWTSTQPESCFITGDLIAATTDTKVTGSRPLVLVATNAINISALVDVSSHRMPAAIGPGSPSSACTTPADIGGSNSSGGGGGAGGSYFSKGGNGGNGKPGADDAPGGVAADADTMLPMRLRAGCNGQKGQQGDVVAGEAGRGGGAIYLVAGTAITVATTGAINASGSSGTGGGDSSGGSGGGSGGTIKLHAPTITFLAGGRLLANGGGASSGGDDIMNGVNGGEANPLMPTMAANGGNGPANGGAGFAGTSEAANGQPGPPPSQNAGGGGGGGGGGLIESNIKLMNAILSAGRIEPP